MKRFLLFLCLLSIAPAVEPPTLTDTQKLDIRNKQIVVSELAREQATLQAQIASAQAAQSRLKALEPELQKASDSLSETVKTLTPAGWILQMDLTFKAQETKNEPKK